MSLDITIKERKEFRRPDCGRLVTTKDIDAVSSGGREWYDFLKGVGYYAEGDNPPKDNDWYGEDMVLTEEQAKQLADFVSEYQPYYARDSDKDALTVPVRKRTRGYRPSASCGAKMDGGVDK